MKLRIKDFQSIKNADIDVSGITIITGKSNAGKTAVIRALNDAIFNNGDDSHVRAGAERCTVELDDGKNRMTFVRDASRKSEKTSYSFNGGAEIRKVGRDQLPEAKEMFGITDVRMANGSHALLNFWNQNDRPFLMDKSPQQLYEFLSLSSAKMYTGILKKMVKDSRDMKLEIAGEAKVIDDNRLMLSQKKKYLASQEGFDGLFDGIRDLDRRQKANTEAVVAMNAVAGAERQIAGIREQLSSMAVYPDISIDDITKRERDIQASEKAVSETEALARRIGQAKTAADGIARYPDISIAGLEKRESRIAGAESSLKEMETLMARASAAREAVAGLHNMPEIDISTVSAKESAIAGAERMLAEGASIEEKMRKTAEMLHAAEVECIRMAGETTAYEKEIGVCPLCGRPFGEHKEEEA